MGLGYPISCIKCFELSAVTSRRLGVPQTETKFESPDTDPRPPLLGGSWDLLTTYNWAYKPTHNPPKWLERGNPNYK